MKRPRGKESKRQSPLSFLLAPPSFGELRSEGISRTFPLQCYELVRKRPRSATSAEQVYQHFNFDRTSQASNYLVARFKWLGVTWLDDVMPNFQQLYYSITTP